MTIEPLAREDPAAFRFDDREDRLRDARRLQVLRRTGLLHAPRLPALDHLTHLAVQITWASAAMVTLVDAERVVLASLSTPEGVRDQQHELPVEQSLCQYVVVNDAPLLVDDARRHPVLARHPAVAERRVVAYAGVPVRSPDGHVLGVLAVVDRLPRRWTPEHLEGLQDLASAVETKIELRLMRREVQLDHEQLTHVLDGARHTLIVTTDADGIVRTMNPTARMALDPAPYGRIEPWSLKELAARFQPGAPELRLGQPSDWVLVGPDGEEQVFSVRISALRDDEDEVDGYVAVGDDVTAQRKTDELLLDTLRSQGEAMRRLEALDAQRRTFMSTASHELRTPVTSILGYTDLLVEGAGGALTERQSELASGVDRNARRLVHLIEDMLTLTRIRAAEVELLPGSVDVNRLVERVRGILSDQVGGRRLAIGYEIDPGVGAVTGDALQLERALLHLLQNAVKFTCDGGSVALSVRRQPGEVVFEVSDTGAGIPQDEQHSVFEPFVRGARAQANAVPGSGIGLAIVRRVAEDHAGRVLLDSEPGRGTTVSLTVPA